MKKGRTHVKDFYSAKKDKTFAADLVMRVEDGRAQYSLEFPKTPMQEVFKTPNYYAGIDIKATYSEISGAWNISGKSLDRGNPLVTNTYGTLRVNAYKLLEDALNLRDTKIYDTIHDADGDHRVLNKQETMLAQQAQESIREAFKQWIFKDLDRREDLCATYNRIFNAIRPREYDGSHIRFEGMTPEISLMPHQKNAVAHILYGKVNRCVDNAFKVWKESAPDRGTQLIFCDLSTPKADGTFNVYDDVREKLVAKGVPREEVAFIHEYNTETKKADLFAKVRAGQVRILMGSTPKLGAGTNIQDRLIALHHLDCPWKPSDLEQQEGRILRQGNRNKQVKIYRYVTENTFDSYMWQILENKRKFISQIMTSKSPVRACDDVDDTALSYAEIKALATGNPYIKEKMDLDIQVSKLKLLKANHTSQIYSLESDIARRYPREIAVAQGQIEALKTDMEAAKPLLAQDKDHFSMEISGKVYTERKEAGAAIIEACKALKVAGTEGRIGSYGAFELHSRFDNFDKVFRLSIKGAWNYSMEVGKDPQGNILRVTNALAGIERTLPQVERRLETLEQQLAQAKEEAKRPFAQEAELAEKSARLAELNSLLNMDEKGSEDALGVDEDAAETEVADKPRQPVNYAGRVAERTADNARKPSVLAQLHAKQAERTAEPQKSQKRKSHDMEL